MGSVSVYGLVGGSMWVALYWCAYVCRCDWVFGGSPFLSIDVVNIERMWSTARACTCVLFVLQIVLVSLFSLFLKATPPPILFSLFCSVGL